MIEVALIVATLLFTIWIWNSLYVIREWERGVVLRLGKIQGAALGPGLQLVPWPVDTLYRISVKPQTLSVASQTLQTQGNANIQASASLSFRVTDAVLAISKVQDYRYALGELAKQAMQQQTSQFTVEDFLYRPETVSERVKASLEKTAREWGLEVLSMEISSDAQ